MRSRSRRRARVRLSRYFSKSLRREYSISGGSQDPPPREGEDERADEPVAGTPPEELERLGRARRHAESSMDEGLHRPVEDRAEENRNESGCRARQIESRPEPPQHVADHCLRKTVDAHDIAEPDVLEEPSRRTREHGSDPRAR